MPVDKETLDQRSPDAETVTDFHRYADTNLRDESIHHELGTTHGKASWGDHNHRDGNGVPLLEDTFFTGSGSANTVDIVRQILEALELLGATDNTVP